MRASLIYLTSALCTGAVAYDTLYAMNTSDFSGISGDSYQCENVMKPSVTCTDPALNNDTCSCTCTNGIIFNQPVPSPDQGSGGNDASLDMCQAEKDQYIEREREAMAKLHEAELAHTSCQKGQAAELEAVRQANAIRESKLQAEVTKFTRITKFKHVGCWNQVSGQYITGSRTVDNAMTLKKCRETCWNFTYYSLHGGNTCACGNGFRPGHLMQPTDCRIPCKGDSRDICGGRTTETVYMFEPNYLI